MSASVLLFTPNAELGARENLKRFVSICRQSEVLDAHRQFASNVWNVGYLKGKNGVHRAVFSTLEAAQVSLPNPSLPSPFLEFAKALVVYLQDRRPVVSISQRVSAFRCLEAALRECTINSQPTAVNTQVLDTAVDLARKHYSAQFAYRVAGQLKLIADCMHSNGFIKLRQPWNHGLKKPDALGSRISQEALIARREKLPSAAALRALAGIFLDAKTAADILASSFMALMVCAPDRINEALRMRRRCIVEGEGTFAGTLGLRWAGSKGAEDAVKWLPTQMTGLARDAVSNLAKVTAPAHAIAAWYTAHPNVLFLHKGATHLRAKENLTPSELAVVLWGDEAATDSAKTWALTTAKLRKVSLGGRRIGFAFKDVERAVVAMLPATFPNMPGDPDLRCEDALAVMRTNECHEARATYLCMFRCVDNQRVTAHLGGCHSKQSIFERFGYTEDDGSPIRLRTHSLRHYLNMLAQMGGLSSTEIAIFSGRRDERQNRAYDHRTSDEIQGPISAAIKAGFTG